LTTAVVGRLDVTVLTVTALVTLWVKFGAVDVRKFTSPV